MDSFAKLIRNPIIVLGADGKIHETRGWSAPPGAEVRRWSDVFTDREQLQGLLSRASASGDAVLGALDIKGAPAATRRRVEVLRLEGEAPRYAVVIRESEDDQFALLTRRVRELNAEILSKQKAQAELEEALAHNRLLYRELQHRVKNHLQMMLALVSAAARESADPQNRAFVQTLQSKLSALFDAQRMMYLDDRAAGVRADEMLNAIADTVGALSGASAVIAVDAERLQVSNDIAFPVALIANELLTNAVKYGGKTAGARIAVVLRREGSDAVLKVSDNGPGFVPQEDRRASSGLGLVRGLARQIGGRVEIESSGGATVILSFPIEEAKHAGA